MANSKLLFDDVAVGSELPPLVKHSSSVQLFMFSAITWNPHRIHYDADFARDTEGLPGTIVHGPLLGCFLSQLVTDWLRSDGKLKKLSWSNRLPAQPGDVLTCRGKVTAKHQDSRLVDCDLWIENQRGERVVRGKATVEWASTAPDGETSG